MACLLFLYAASGLVAPGWAVAALLSLWLVLFVVGCRWWTRHPGWVPLLPLAGVVLWVGAVAAGGAWLGWTA